MASHRRGVSPVAAQPDVRHELQINEPTCQLHVQRRACASPCRCALDGIGNSPPIARACSTSSMIACVSTLRLTHNGRASALYAPKSRHRLSGSGQSLRARRTISRLKDAGGCRLVKRPAAVASTGHWSRAGSAGRSNGRPQRLYRPIRREIAGEKVDQSRSDACVVCAAHATERQNDELTTGNAVMDALIFGNRRVRHDTDAVSAIR